MKHVRSAILVLLVALSPSLAAGSDLDELRQLVEKKRAGLEPVVAPLLHDRSVVVSVSAKPILSFVDFLDALPRETRATKFRSTDVSGQLWKKDIDCGPLGDGSQYIEIDDDDDSQVCAKTSIGKDREHDTVVRHVHRHSRINGSCSHPPDDCSHSQGTDQNKRTRRVVDGGMAGNKDNRHDQNRSERAEGSTQTPEKDSSEHQFFNHRSKDHNRQEQEHLGQHRWLDGRSDRALFKAEPDEQ